MKTITIDKIKYNIPDKWSDMTMRQYIQLRRLNAEDNPNISKDIMKNYALISVYLGIPISILKKLKYSKFLSLFQYLEFTKTPMEDNPIHEFEYKGDKYSVLDTLLEQESQDFLTIQSIRDNNPDEPWMEIPYIVAVCAKKEGESLDDYDLEERVKHFEELPIPIVNKLEVFFCSVKKLSDLRSLISINKDKIIQAKVNECNDTLKKAGGKGLFSNLLIGILQKYLQYIKKQWVKYSNSLTSNQEKI